MPKITPADVDQVSFEYNDNDPLTIYVIAYPIGGVGLTLDDAEIIALQLLEAVKIRRTQLDTDVV